MSSTLFFSISSFNESFSFSIGILLPSSSYFQSTSPVEVTSFSNSSSSGFKYSLYADPSDKAFAKSLGDWPKSKFTPPILFSGVFNDKNGWSNLKPKIPGLSLPPVTNSHLF